MCYSRLVRSKAGMSVYEMPKYSFDFVTLISICACTAVQGFNLDAKFPISYRSSTSSLKDSYFGYAVDFYADSEQSWIIVGAPKAANGKVLRCASDSSGHLASDSCSSIVFPRATGSQAKVPHLLGSTVAVGKEKELLVCAPKFTHVKEESGAQTYFPIGACYLVSNFTADNSNAYEYLPCKNNLGNGFGQDHGFCEAGFSATFFKDNSAILLGAVGSYYNQGSLIVIDENLYRNIDRLDKHTSEVRPTVPNGWTEKDYYQQSYDNNYLGYSVESNHGINGDTFFVTSAPRRLGFDLLGSVNVYDDQLRSLIVNFTGEQVGEYFGHGLAMIDLNGDKLDDIIVGSPLYTDLVYKLPETGRIYIYYQTKSSGSSALSFSQPTIINGNATMGRFGNTITSLGDVNGDDYQDFLVSAPYERNNSEGNSQDAFGALYVFNGGPDGAGWGPSQVIHGASLERILAPHTARNIRGLGFSIKGGKDIDNNGYPDVVAGAYLSGQALVIRARPVVKLHAKNSVEPEKIYLDQLSCTVPATNLKTSCFQIQSCFSYEGKSLPASIQFFYSYDVDSDLSENDKRAYMVTSSRNMTLQAGSESNCVTETVYLKQDVKDKVQPVAVTLSYWLKETGQPVEPILDQITGTSSAIIVEMDKNCGADNFCVPDLQTNSVIDPGRVVVGAYTEVIVTSKVANRKENAYQTLLNVQYPLTTSFISVVGERANAVNCLDVNKTVVCDVANPLKSNDEVEIELKFGIFDESGDVANLAFIASANCSNEKPYTSNEVELSVDVEVEAIIQIFNASLPEIIALEKLSESVNTSGTIEVTHTYELTNMGPSSISSARISILWPLKLKNGDLLLGLKEIVDSDSVTCHGAHVINASKALQEMGGSPANIASKDESTTANYYSCVSPSDYCAEVTCDVDSLAPKEDLLITLKGVLRVEPLVSSEMDSIITSNLVFEILEYPYKIGNDAKKPLTQSEINTAAVHDNAPVSSVQWWVIIVAAVGGILFLLFIILILWKCGFFKRKTIPKDGDDGEMEKLHQAELKQKEHEGLE